MIFILDKMVKYYICLLAQLDLNLDEEKSGTCELANMGSYFMIKLSTLISESF